MKQFSRLRGTNSVSEHCRFADGFGISSNRIRLLMILSCTMALFYAMDSRVAAQSPPKDEVQEKGPPPALDVYMGRRIAQTMHYAGAEWLIRDTREREERCSLLLANLPLKTGMTVCDMGCGNGFYSLPIAQAIGKRGRVLAVDIQVEMLNMLRERMESESIENITPILGSMYDPRLPENSVDLVLLVDVYHEFSHPEQMLAAMRRSLKPDGKIVLVEYRGEDPDVPIRPEHKMTKEQIMLELPANGYQLVDEFDKLPWQHVMIFGRDDSRPR